MPWNARLLGAAQVYAALDTLGDLAAGNPTWVVGTNVYYSVFVEFGTSRSPAQPYFRPAVEHAKRNLGAYMKSAPNFAAGVAAIAHAVEKKAKRLAPVDTGRLRASIRAERVQT